MNAMKQIGTALELAVLSICNRVGASLVVIAGMLGVIVVVLAILALADGVAGTLGSSGRSDRAIVVRKGANSEGASVLPRAAVDVIAGSPGIRQSSAGGPIASYEMIGVITLPK